MKGPDPNPFKNQIGASGNREKSILIGSLQKVLTCEVPGGTLKAVDALYTVSTGSYLL